MLIPAFFRSTRAALAGLVLGVMPAVFAADTFKAVNSMDSPRENHTATLLTSGEVPVAGGWDGLGLQSSAELYAPATGTWRLTGALTTARNYHVAVRLPDGKVLVAGGADGQGSSLSSAELYDPGNGTWSFTGAMGVKRQAATAVLLATGKVLIAGGMVSNTFNGVTASAELYDPATGAWSPTGPMVEPGYLFQTSTLLPDGKVLLNGGDSPWLTFNTDGTLRIGPPDPELYDPATGFWRLTPTRPALNGFLSATSLLSGQVLLSGRSSVGSNVVPFATLYDPAASTWTTTGPLHTARQFQSATLLASGEVLTCGGMAPTGSPPADTAVASAELYDPTTGTWRPTAAMTMPHQYHSATRLANGDVLITGGDDVNGTPIPYAEVFHQSLRPGHYDGLVTPAAGSGPGVDSVGRFMATVHSNQAFSARLSLFSTTIAVVGTFDENGVARFGPARSTSLVLPLPGVRVLLTNTLELHLDLSLPASANKIRGSVTSTFANMSLGSSTIDADRAFYDGLGPGVSVPAVYLGRASAPGLFTAILPALDLGSQPPVFTTADYPQGTGFGTFRLSSRGSITFAGVLADGTAVTTAATLGHHDAAPLITFPFYAMLYRDRSFSMGFISSRVSLDSTNPDSDFSGQVQWSRPYSGGQYYPYGWPEVIVTGLSGSKYSASPGRSLPKGPLAATPAANAMLDIEKGNLAAPFTRTVSISSTGLVTKVDPTDLSFSLGLNRGTGVFGGWFRHDDGSAPAFQGILYEKGRMAGGHGFFLTTQPRLIDYQGQSGVVNLTRVFLAD